MKICVLNCVLCVIIKGEENLFNYVVNFIRVCFFLYDEIGVVEIVYVDIVVNYFFK